MRNEHPNHRLLAEDDWTVIGEQMLLNLVTSGATIYTTDGVDVSDALLARGADINRRFDRVRQQATQPRRHKPQQRAL